MNGYGKPGVRPGNPDRGPQSSAKPETRKATTNSSHYSEELCGAQAPAIGSGPTGADYSDGLLGAAGLAVALLAFAATQASAQCAMCGTALQGDDPLARGIFWSVLFLISLPYAIVGAFVAVFVWLSRRGKTRRAPLTGGLSLVVGRKENAK